MSSAADARITAERDETKHVLDAAWAQQVASALRRRLPTHRFCGEGANELPGARHYVTTIYFDTPSRELYRAACASDRSLKLRAKEYYDLHPSLAEVARNPRDLVRYHPVLWLEIKWRDGVRTGKRRVGIPKADVPEFFGTGRITRDMAEIQEGVYGSDAAAVLAELSALCGRFREPLRADTLVNYRRLAWQDEAGDLRVTLDVGPAFFRPPEDLWSRRHALVREALGTPAGTEPRCVLEVKTRRQPPPWLADLLAKAHARPVAYSKFEEASRAVHG